LLHASYIVAALYLSDIGVQFVKPFTVAPFPGIVNAKRLDPQMADMKQIKQLASHNNVA